MTMADFPENFGTTLLPPTDEVCLTISTEELRTIARRAKVFFGDIPLGCPVQIVLVSGCPARWYLDNETVVAWFDASTHPTNVRDDDVNAIVTLPLDFLLAISEQYSHCDELDLLVDPVGGNVRVSEDGVCVTAPIGGQRDLSRPYFSEDGQAIVTRLSDLLKAAYALSFPLVLPKAIEVFDEQQPFVNLTCKGEWLIARRNWKKFSGGEVSVDIGIRGTWDRDVELESETFLATCASLADFEDVDVELKVLHHGPSTLLMEGPTFGCIINIQTELSAKYKDIVAEHLAVSGYDFDDFRYDGDVVFSIFVDELELTVNVVHDQGADLDFIRLQTIACRNVEINDFIAQELNSWNTSLPGIKLLHDNDRIIVRYEVPAQHLETLVTHIDLVRETAEGVRMVREVFS